MAQQSPDIQSLLAALAAQRPVSTPQSNQPPSYNPLQSSTPLSSGYALPQPSSSGAFDLSSIKPVNSGSVSMNDALAKARDFAAGKGISYDSRNNKPFTSSRSRSRSRSPLRRDTYNSYRDDRRDDSRRGGGYGRERSRSPGRGNRFTSPPGRNNNNGSVGRDRDDDSEIINIDSNLVGLVIGRQGENLRRVEQETRARIQFITPPDHPGPQRQCRISGPLRTRNDAKREIHRIIEENQREQMAANNISKPVQQTAGIKLPSQPVLRDGENSMQIMVPDRTVGLIIGRGGETIRDLQDRSGCHINIVGVNKSVNGLRPVNLIGSTQAANKAKELIMEIVESDTRAANESQSTSQPQQYQAQQPPPPQQQQVRQHHQQQQHHQHQHQQQQQQDPSKISETIKVPSDAVGMIIGKGGETIKEMQITTNCKINVSQPVGADADREIGLVGTLSAIEAAKKAIWEKVDMAREKSQARSSGRNDNNNNNNNNNNHNNQNQQYNQSNDKQADADPYAQYGGYQNYVALWYAAVAGGQQQPGAAPQ